MTHLIPGMPDPSPATGHTMRKNWAGNLTYTARDVIAPRSVEELQRAFTHTTGPITLLGSTHCFNDIANTTGTHILTSRLEPLPENPLTVDAQSDGTGIVRVPGGATYGAVAQKLAADGWSLSNFASLPHITIAGAIATGTHGSGDTNQALVGAVDGFTLVTPRGDVLHARRDGTDDLPWESAVHLGALGAVVFVDLRVHPAFLVRQDLMTNLSWGALDAQFDAVTSAAYSVSMFTRWDGEGVDQVWLKSAVHSARTESGSADARQAGAAAASADAPPPGIELLTALGAMPATEKLHPLPHTDPVHCTDQLGVPGAPLDRLPHFKMGFTPSKGEELQSEYLIPRRHALAAIAAVRELGPRIVPLLFVSEIRTMAPDGAWLSPSGVEPTVGLHFTWRPMERDVLRFLPDLEAALAPFDARPHWGKLHRFGRDRLESLYPKIGEFRVLAAELDPERRLVNRHLAEVVGL